MRELEKRSISYYLAKQEQTNEEEARSADSEWILEMRELEKRSISNYLAKLEADK